MTIDEENEAIQKRHSCGKGYAMGQINPKRPSPFLLNGSPKIVPSEPALAKMFGWKEKKSLS